MISNEIKDSYQSYPARIKKIIRETEHVNTYVIEAIEENDVFNPIPGQFAIWDLPGIGEAPFSYSSIRDGISFTIHKIGGLTSNIFKMKENDEILIRGPYGNGFPIDKMKGKDILFIMGGIGAAPLRGVLHYVLDNSEKFGNICILHGARSPDDILFLDEFKDYKEDLAINCNLTVDIGNEFWDDNIGVVTKLFDKVRIKDVNNTVALICGPPIMYKYVLMELEKLKIPEEQVFLTLERKMKCGIGKCGHCAVDDIYVCTNGPVFTYWDVKNMEDLL